MEVQATSQLSVAETLREKIQEYLNRHPNITLQTLATRSNVPVTSLRRLMNEESKSEVAPHSVLNICSYVYKEKNISTLLKKIPENLSSYIEKHFGQFIFGGTEIKYSCDLNILLQDRQSYFIYKLAANHNGTDYIEITELFGSIGKKKVDELIQLGAIIKDSSDRLHAKDKNFSLDLNVATSHLPELVKFYKPEALAQGKNLFYSLSESMTAEAIQEIKNVQRDAVKKIHAIMNDKDNFGEIPYFTINLAETFTSDSQGEIQ